MRSPLAQDRRRTAEASLSPENTPRPLSLRPDNPHSRALLGGEVHVWSRPLLASPSEMERFIQSLSREEASRARSFVFLRDRLDFVVCRGFLRELLSRYCDVRPSEPEILYSALGKPMVLTAPQSLHFNISHSGGECVIALAAHDPVGIDLERLDPQIDTEVFRNSVFSDREFEEWERIPSSDRLHAFFGLWTQKESFLKGIGVGVGFPLRELDVTLKPWNRPVLVSSRRQEDPAIWRFESAAVHPDFVCTLALRPVHRELKVLRGAFDLFGL